MMDASSHKPEGNRSDVDEERLTQLASLSTLEYERQRKQSASDLGCREAALDSLVQSRRKQGSSRDTLQGRSVALPEIEPWPEPVDGANVLSELAETFLRYIALPGGAADVLALWCAHAHCYEVFQCSPRLNIASPEKQCGKTTLRDLLALFVPRPLATENLTVAVLFRVVQQSKPTLLADECDTWIRSNEELRGLLNAGHRRGGQAMRCVGDDYEVRGFEVFSPAVLCGIGSLPETLQDRSIKISLRRAKPGEVSRRFDSRRINDEPKLGRKLARFCSGNRKAFEDCDPSLPLQATNRLADNWRPLFAVAEVAGGDWPSRAVQAFNQLGTRDEADEHGLGTMLLSDIRAVLLDQSNPGRIFSRTLVEALWSLTDRPWLEVNRGRMITENWLARRITPFGIQSRTIRIGGDRAKGYEVADFSEAFERYLSSDDDSIRDNVTRQETSDSSEASIGDNKPDCHGSESQEMHVTAELSRCHGLELSKRICPYCHGVGLLQKVKTDNSFFRIELDCQHCGETIETNVPGSDINRGWEATS
jgi:putative DNA primase/helicase